MAANDNRTHIYRIRRKEDGKFLSWAPSKEPGASPKFDATGCFWRTQETIIEHLITLCQFWVYCADGGHVHKPTQTMRKRLPHAPALVIYPHGKYPKHLVSTNYHWLDRYEVVATEISVHGENTMEAREFAALRNDDALYDRGARHAE